MRILRLGAILVAAVVLLTVSARLGMSEALAGRDPEAAIQYWPRHAVALSRVATKVTLNPDATAANIDVAAAQAREAIRLDATARAALTLLALTGRAAAPAERTIRYVESLSRRDLAVQMFLIEQAVAKDDVDLALRHYDTALRTTADGNDVLFPVLVGASTDPAIAAKLARILVKDHPKWELAFINWAIGGAASADGILGLDAALRAAGGGISQEQRIYLLQRLEREWRYRDAFALHRGYLAGPMPLVRNGGFEREDVFPLIDWTLRGDADIGAERVPDPGSGEANVLALHASEGVTGEVARQLLQLPPGRMFTLSLTSSGAAMPGLPPDVSVTCIEGNVQLAEIALTRPGRLEATGKAVPANCPHQWLRVRIRNTPLPDQVWLDNIGIRLVPKENM